MEIDRAKASRVRMVALDVDGVLTDNGIWVGPVAGERVELKRFDIQDGLGIKLLQRAGITVALVSGRLSEANRLRTAGISVIWLSGRDSEATTMRGEELQVEEVLQVPGPEKLKALEAVRARRGLGWEDLAYVGDDLADLQVMRRVGLPIAVANAVAEIRAVADCITTARGGHGAVREVADGLLKARGVWPEMLERYFSEGGDRDD